MAQKPTEKPSELELQVLSLLWRSRPMTAREVLEAMPDRKPRAYTTILSVMQVMEKKGLLKRDSQAVTHVWRPAVTRRQVLGPMLRAMVRNVFGGSASAVLQQLLSAESVDREELDEIRRVLDEHAAERGDCGAGNQPKGEGK